MKYIAHLIVVCFLFACGKTSSPSITSQTSTIAQDETVAATTDRLAFAEKNVNKDNTPPTPAEPASQKIIKTARISFAVDDFAAAKKRITDIVSKTGGYLSSEVESRGSTEWRNHLEIKVPAAAFDSCVGSLTSGVSRLDQKNITSQDVTAEYVDLDARMKTRIATEQRYLDILKQARNVKEILEVEVQLKAIREEIEAAKGRLQYIDHQVSYSMIYLDYYQTLALSAPEGPGFLQRSWLSVREGWNSLLGLTIEGLGLWPFMLIIIFIFIFIKRRLKRNRKQAVTS
ncbi:DUF4349 domain-containing protein [Chitinophaga sp. HK235]|uniref:DUF4349 domain-containing protein n=1 Tax=Chitinophaga sp. HK235 TaxID=2952571 RepID=UPI001BAE38F8|nr:DUF4349 domain-containing protein [Chitinophaga sp. HK235]